MNESNAIMNKSDMHWVEIYHINHYGEEDLACRKETDSMDRVVYSFDDVEEYNWREYDETRCRLRTKDVDYTTELIYSEDGNDYKVDIQPSENDDEDNDGDGDKENYEFKPFDRGEVKKLKIPQSINYIICQNCDTVFQTKYLYQRHQCEFNADKVVLKPELKGQDMDKASRIRYECEVCKKSFISINNLDRHRNCHQNKDDNVCTGCNKVFISANRLKIHKENHCKKTDDMKFYRSDINVWLCEICKQVYPSEKVGKMHLSTCTGGIADDSDELELANLLTEIKTEILYQCEFCNCTYATKHYLLPHQHTHTTVKNYECIICNQVFINYTEATTHWQQSCNIFNLFYLQKMTYCEQCDRSFKSHELLYNHKNKKQHFTPKKITDTSEEQDVREEIMKMLDSIVCKIETNQATKKRGRKRKEPRPEFVFDEKNYQYQCEKCSLVYATTNELDAHKRVDHASIYVCEICGQVVHSEKAFMIHSRAHQSLKPYVCDQCGRRYSQTSHLWQHMRFHQGIKPFACPHEGCEARYTIRPDLKDHIRKIHTRERPFKCNVCQKCFLTGSVYYQHRLIHTNDRRYACEYCEKRFFRADALNNHRRIHTDERPFPCPVCGREFRQKGDLNKHIRTQHTL